MKRLRFHSAWMGLGWLMVAVTIYVSLMAEPPQLLIFSHADKLEHAATFAGLMVWFGQLAAPWRAAIGLLLLGVAIEVLQSFTATRIPELADMVADGAGILLGLLLLRTPLGRLLSGIERRFLV